MATKKNASKATQITTQFVGHANSQTIRMSSIGTMMGTSGRRYRVVVNADRSYTSQAWATVEVWGQGEGESGWMLIHRLEGENVTSRKSPQTRGFETGPAHFRADFETLLRIAAAVTGETYASWL